ncbi:hypothetical protein L249_2253 [Ophiocordyceps polyrhachis-furcata BCC 54312]|uniref:Uncharacterized protein n=1 Tax=Ophiocordyceps polyrhachis-furcata BCC 54312 TaxID=1330021 RepID=A0A367LQ32_9HYPO|nr:hypothetical protein L249_2253 [Ophiocordyceps polyrhachis-furcata BCC 54312]
MSSEVRKDDDAVQPKSSHTSDEFLRPFLKPTFDPASFLNGRLEKGTPLAQLSTQSQALVSQLDGQTTRMTDTLTQLTDDILRSGSRLAYEVELLRGETVGLSETLHETLQDDVRQFVPGGLRREAGGQETMEGGDSGGEAEDPDCIKQLQALTLVRAQLESVIKIFGAAMDFGFPPSEVSVGSSFLSVSAPEPGSEQQSSEEKGQQALRRLRDEVSELLGSNSKNGDDDDDDGDDDEDSAVQGIEKAATRVAELKELARVWRGTAEEKGRNRFIDSLAKMVEDRHRELMLESGRRDGKAEAEARVQPGGFGLMSQLQKLRSGL